MLRSLYVMLDYHLSATDGVQGIVQDFLFDDETWIVHYLVAETASPLGRRKVLILPFAAERPDWEMKRVPVLLSCEQIRTSPPLAVDMPIGKQWESGRKQPGSHLRSLREVLGYSVRSTDGEAGSVEDLIIEDTLWGVHSVIIALKKSPRSVLLPPESIQCISWPDKTVLVSRSRQEIANGPVFDPAAPASHGSEHCLYDYYGRPVYSPPPVVSEDLAKAR